MSRSGPGRAPLKYASELLVFDDEISKDHWLGGRVMLFVSDADLPANRLLLVAASY
jgi:hypothetical protein